MPSISVKIGARTSGKKSHKKLPQLNRQISLSFCSHKQDILYTICAQVHHTQCIQDILHTIGAQVHHTQCIQDILHTIGAQVHHTQCIQNILHTICAQVQNTPCIQFEKAKVPSYDFHYFKHAKLIIPTCTIVVTYIVCYIHSNNMIYYLRRTCRSCWGCIMGYVLCN